MIGSIKKKDMKYAKTDPNVVSTDVSTVPNQGP